MFCLRSWIPILFFLTNASPIYLILFVSATYMLNRPCVYCSMLLFILVVSLFDFHTSWFEPRYAHPEALFAASSTANSTTAESAVSSLGSLVPIPSVVSDAVSVAGAVVNSTLGGIVGKGVHESSGSAMGEWIRGVMRKEWRINCFDITIRL